MKQEQAYFDKNDTLKGFTDYLNTVLPSDKGVLSDELLNEIVRTQVSDQQLQKMPQDIANIITGASKATAQTISAALDKMNDEQIKGLPLVVLQRLQEYFPTEEGQK